MATQRIRRVDPVQLAKLMGVMYGLLGLLLAPFLFLMSRFGPDQTTQGVGIGLAVIAPIAYAIIGAIGTFIAALIYNLVAGWVGGIEVDLEPTGPQMY